LNVASGLNPSRNFEYFIKPLQTLSNTSLAVWEKLRVKSCVRKKVFFVRRIFRVLLVQLISSDHLRSLMKELS